eukprot:243891-Pleurochrysis_carterae.AAC.1
MPTKANGYKEVKVVVTALPPLIIEVCSRSHNRKVLEVSFNLQTLNDLNGQRLPPDFAYMVGKDVCFRRMALGH